jgi:hypothetical protein
MTLATAKLKPSKPLEATSPAFQGTRANFPISTVSIRRLKEKKARLIFSTPALVLLKGMCRFLPLTGRANCRVLQ